MFGAQLRCPVCNQYTPDRCVCNKPADLKGVKGGNCNRTACQKPNAWWYNSGSWAYYCRACALEINKCCPKDEPLCTNTE